MDKYAFNCNKWMLKIPPPQNYVPYCVAEKALPIIGVVCLVFSLYLIWVHVKVLGFNLTSIRVKSLIIAAIGSLNVMIHYTVLNSVYQYRLYSLEEIFRFVLFYLICYYYTYKATGLL